MGGRILVVDDDELVRSGLRINLQREGYEVVTAASAEEALVLAAGQPMDLILCDLIMNGLDGMGLLAEARTRWPEVPVILITAHGSIRNALDALQQGARDYIQKPASPDEVLHRVRTVLDQERLRGALAQERRRTEGRRKEMDEQMARAERMMSLGLLAEGAAGHLREILGPLDGLRRQLLADPLPAGAVAQVAARLEEVARRSGQVVEDLQAIGQSSHHDKQSVPLLEVVNLALKSPDYLRVRRAHPQVRVEVHGGCGELRVRASPAALAQAVENLLANALESAAPAGHVDVLPGLELEERPQGRYGRGRAGSYVVLRVRDSGPPLSDEDAERFFEPFYAQRRMARQELSGLGLTLVVRVVEDHGGYVHLTHEGGGNTFEVHLPAVTEGMASEATWNGTESVLVVDDYPAHRDRARALLEGLGYEVSTAEGVEDALAQCRSRAAAGRGFQLVLMDLLLGEGADGVDAVQALWEEHPTLKAVLVSGFAEIGRIVEARKLGVRHCLQKPLAVDALAKAVRAELDQPVE